MNKLETGKTKEEITTLNVDLKKRYTIFINL
jgi:hypothetical protein